MVNWNPGQYLKFRNERTQPSIDLVAKINLDDPKTIIDLGCGPGNSTQVLAGRWPEAAIAGLDSSAEMIEEAKKEYPEQRWIVANIGHFETKETYDLVFSNAALQWVPGHDLLLPGLLSLVNTGGALAVQVPANSDSPLHKALLSTAQNVKWRNLTQGCQGLLHYGTPAYYYDLLSPTALRFELWETTYYHVLPSHKDLIEWYKGTGMRPFLERLPDEGSKDSFQGAVLEACQDEYPPQKDGKVLYPFKRLFFVAYK